MLLTLHPVLTFTRLKLVIGSNDPASLTITIPVIMEIVVSVELTSFTALMDGFYDGNTMVPDTVTVELHNSTVPYSLIDQTKIVLNSSGHGTGKFYNAVNGTPYYIVLKHRNSIETWSALPQTFTNSELSYDFTTGSNKAFGNNLKQIGTKWCIYSGDVNQDGIVNNQDVILVLTDNIIGITGYTSTDINGDAFTEIKDLSLVFINNVFGVQRSLPQAILLDK